MVRFKCRPIYLINYTPKCNKMLCEVVNYSILKIYGQRVENLLSLFLKERKYFLKKDVFLQSCKKELTCPDSFVTK